MRESTIISPEAPVPQATVRTEGDIVHPPPPLGTRSQAQINPRSITKVHHVEGRVQLGVMEGRNSQEKILGGGGGYSSHPRHFQPDIYLNTHSTISLLLSSAALSWTRY